MQPSRTEIRCRYAQSTNRPKAEGVISLWAIVLLTASARDPLNIEMKKGKQWVRKSAWAMNAAVEGAVPT